MRFARYADDCIIFVGSKAAATRVIHSVTRYIKKKLGLKVNAEKSKIEKTTQVKYLVGYGFWKDYKENKWKARPHQESIKRFKGKLKELTQRKISINFDLRFKKLNEVIRGWINYYKIGNMKRNMQEISQRLRTRLRMICWKMWKVPSKREGALKKMGIDKDLARRTSYCGDRYYFVATKTCLVRAITKKRLENIGLIDPYDYYVSRACV